MIISFVIVMNILFLLIMLSEIQELIRAKKCEQIKKIKYHKYSVSFSLVIFLWSCLILFREFF